MPAMKGASAAFQVRGMTRACAVSLRTQPLRQRAMLAQREPPARQIRHDPLADPGHVVEQWRHHGGGQHVDGGRRVSSLQQLDDAMAADEIADPHVRHEQIGASRAVAGDLTSTNGKSLEWEFILVLN